MPHDLHKPTPPGALTIRAGADRIGWTEQAVRNQLSRDPTLLPHTFTVGGRRFFVAEEVEKWLEDRATMARAAFDAASRKKTRNTVEHCTAVRTGALLSEHQASIIAGTPGGVMRSRGAPFERIGRRWYIRPTALRQYLESPSNLKD